ncbi:MAG: aminodeoxychorismate synthase component I [Duganella sp.]
MNADCFALLDDASPSAATDGAPVPTSRLYTGHVATLRCDAMAGWPDLLARMQAALARGQYAVTLCSYELGEQLLDIDGVARAAASCAAPFPLPLAQVLLFEHCALMTAAEVGDWLAARALPIERPAGIANVRANVDQQRFDAALARIHAYIEAGDTYQVNYTMRLRFDAFGGLHALYARLRARQPVPYGALVQLDDGSAVVSLSPELFVRHERGVLTARPMKGTAPASQQPDDNSERARALASDPKNRAENLMIVDLLRNDIARVAQTGSVKVPALFEVHRYSSVLQMTSTITAALRPDATLAQIFDALYPCGSITGAPKRRTMEIIRALEPDPRGIYTGAIGWFDPPVQGGGTIGDFCLSVPIRTLALSAPDAASGVRHGEMGVGAGIVYDSVSGDEYAECRLKARFLTGLSNDFEIFETMYATPADGVRHRARHLQRLAASAAYFGFAWDAQAANAYLDAACAMLADEAAYRVRLALAQSGAFTVQHAPLMPLMPPGAPVRVLLADDATDAGDLFLRHKTSVRTRYDSAWRDAEAHGAFDTLFFNQRGELTEGGRSSVFVQLAGQWVTPALHCGVLPGVMRGVLLDDPQWNAREAVITRAMLAQADGLVVCNALRGALPALLSPVGGQR